MDAMLPAPEAAVKPVGKHALLVVYACVAVAAASLWLAAPSDDARVRGLWTQYRSSDVGDPLRFYYFHEGGIGLYRYGKVGLNHTNSFDYKVDDRRITLVFRKTGARHEVPYRIEEQDGARWLVLEEDPKGPGTVRYRWLPPPADEAPAPAKGPSLGGRLWIDQQRWATGGTGFSMYQLNAGAIDGRGVGWFHQGDYDDWSTEALNYRVQGDRLELDFLLRKERASTRFVVEGRGDERALVLFEDPRGFWHRRRLVDGGPSFGAFDALSRTGLGLYGSGERR